MGVTVTGDVTTVEVTGDTTVTVTESVTSVSVSDSTATLTVQPSETSVAVSGNTTSINVEAESQEVVVNDSTYLGNIGTQTLDGSLSITGHLTHGGDLNDTSSIKHSDFTSAGFMRTDGSGNYTVDSNTYLTSFTELNDLSASVTWADVPDDNITETSVTQHQSALSIEESQISDLQSYLTSYTETDPVFSAHASSGITATQISQWDTAYGWDNHADAGYLTSFTETNDLSTAVTWANVPDANITESSVTQHQTAINSGVSITESQISDFGTYLTTHQDISGKADLTGATFTGTITAPNLDISTTGTVTTNIATGNNVNGTNTKTVNIGTGYSVGQPAALTTVNIGSQAVNAPNTINIGSGTGATNTINLKGNVTLDGSLNVGGDTYEKVQRTRFLKRGYSSTSTINTLTTSLARIGELIQTKSSDGSENELEFSMGLHYSNTYGTNDGVFYVTVTAPVTSNEDTVNLGTVTSVTLSGSLYTISLAGDVTKHLSPYCGMSVNANGSSAFGFNNNQGWYYYNFNNTTYITMYAYQANKPVQGDTVYLHPFDWESSNTEILGTEYQFDSVVYNASLMFRQYQNVYLGYFKSNIDVQVKAKEVVQAQGEDGTTISVRSIEGKVTQTES